MTDRACRHGFTECEECKHAAFKDDEAMTAGSLPEGLPVLFAWIAGPDAPPRIGENGPNGVLNESDPTLSGKPSMTFTAPK